MATPGPARIEAAGHGNAEDPDLAQCRRAVGRQHVLEGLDAFEIRREGRRRNHQLEQAAGMTGFAIGVEDLRPGAGVFRRIAGVMSEIQVNSFRFSRPATGETAARSEPWR